MLSKSPFWFCLILSSIIILATFPSRGEEFTVEPAFFQTDEPALLNASGYDGEWSGVTDQDYNVYFMISDNTVSNFSTDFYVSGNSCDRHFNISGYSAPIVGNGFSISADVPAYLQFQITGSIGVDNGKYVCSGTWYAKSYECNAEASGTWQAEGPPAQDLWCDAVDLGGGWKWLDWFGYFNVNNSPWIYHQEHEWLYPFGETTASIVFWDIRMGAFWWTSASVYPNLYRFSDGAWLWYDVGSNNPRWFYNYMTSRWESD